MQNTNYIFRTKTLIKSVLFFTIMLLFGIPSGAQTTLSAEPVRDSVIIQYFFGFASAWDDTVYYTQIFYRVQDSLDKKDRMVSNWNKYLKHDLDLREHTGFISGPFYDSSYAVKNRDEWIEEIPDTLPGKEIIYIPEDGHGEIYLDNGNTNNDNDEGDEEAGEADNEGNHDGGNSNDQDDDQGDHDDGNNGNHGDNNNGNHDDGNNQDGD